jgi:hypothetical protein
MSFKCQYNRRLTNRLYTQNDFNQRDLSLGYIRKNNINDEVLVNFLYLKTGFTSSETIVFTKQEKA